MSEIGVFTDVENREWRPKLTVPVIREACRMGDITIQRLMTLDVNIGVLVDVLWLACRDEAASRGVSEEQFWTAVPPAKLDAALEALWHQVELAFPQAAEFRESFEGGGPFGRGPTTTS